MNKKVYVVILLLCFLISGCSSNIIDKEISSQGQAVDLNQTLEKTISFEEHDDLSQMNFNNNFSGGSYNPFSIIDGDVYVNYPDENGITTCYQYKADGEKTPIGKHLWNYQKIQDGYFWIYFEDNLDPPLFRFLINGNQQEFSAEKGIPTVGESGVYFFEEQGEKEILYRMSFDGESKKVLLEVPAETRQGLPLEYQGKLWLSLYWNSKKPDQRSDQLCLYQLDLDGKNPVSIIEGNGEILGMRNNCIYAGYYGVIPTIKRYNISTGEIKDISLPEPILFVDSIRFTDDYCYMLSENKLYRVDQTFENPKRIAEDIGIQKIVVIENRLFICYDRNYYSEIDQDGNILQTFE